MTKDFLDRRWARENAERHKEIIEIQRQQIEIQKKQTEIQKKQTKFNRILALATTVLAIGILLNILFKQPAFPKNFGGFILSFILLLTVICITLDLVLDYYKKVPEFMRRSSNWFFNWINKRKKKTKK